MLPERDHTITVEKENEMREAYASSHETRGFPMAHANKFHNDQVKKLVETKGAEVFVVTMGMDEEGRVKPILSVRSNNEEEISSLRLELSFP